MKRKEFNDLKSRSAKDLAKMIMEKRVEAAKKRMESKSGKEKNLKVFAVLRREIAQLLTILREREIIESLKPVEVVEEVKAKKGAVK